MVKSIRGLSSVTVIGLDIAKNVITRMLLQECYYGDGVDGAPTGIDVPRWSLSEPI